MRSVTLPLGSGARLYVANPANGWPPVQWSLHVPAKLPFRWTAAAAAFLVIETSMTPFLPINNIPHVQRHVCWSPSIWRLFYIVTVKKNEGYIFIRLYVNIYNEDICKTMLHTQTIWVRQSVYISTVIDLAFCSGSTYPPVNRLLAVQQISLFFKD